MFRIIPSSAVIPDHVLCNLYSQTKSQDAMRHVFDDVVEEGEVFEDVTGNLPTLTGIFPDYAAPIIRQRPKGGWQMARARWGCRRRRPFWRASALIPA